METPFRTIATLRSGIAATGTKTRFRMNAKRYATTATTTGIVDAVELVGGSAPDDDANDVIDWCELESASTSFESSAGFSLGPISGQLGWYEDTGGVSVTTISDVPIGPMPSDSVYHVRLSNDPAKTGDHALVVGPEMKGLGGGGHRGILLRRSCQRGRVLARFTSRLRIYVRMARRTIRR